MEKIETGNELVKDVLDSFEPIPENIAKNIGYYVGKSLSSRTICGICEKKIPLNTMRFSAGGGYRTALSYFCSDCIRHAGRYMQGHK